MFSSQNSQVSSDVNYIEDVFSTYLYTGTSAAQTITNNIDLAGKGGLVWTKSRTNGVINSNILKDTVRGGGNYLYSDSTSAQDIGDTNFSFNSSGFTLSSSILQNQSTIPYVSWTFREQPKFFDVVTWTTTGSTNARIPHSLGSIPGFYVIKRVDGVGGWFAYHTSLGINSYLSLNTSNASAPGTNCWGATNPTSTDFGIDEQFFTNGSPGLSYIAYIFAHNAGGFGLTGNDNVISCGTFTTDGTGAAGNITLGYESQLVMFKRSDGVGNWQIVDTMRGSSLTSYNYISPTVSNAESSSTSTQGIYPTATGFYVGNNFPGANQTYVYIAIRRGPMKVPTLGTSVFQPVTRTGTGAAATVTSGINQDSVWQNWRSDALGSADHFVYDRLRGFQKSLFTNLSSAEVTQTTGISALNNTTYNIAGAGSMNSSGGSYVDYAFRRAPGFFDEVCYTGDSTNNRAITHNLSAIPELIIAKRRSASANWPISTFSNGTLTNRLLLNSSGTSSGGGNGTISAASSTTFTVTEGATSFDLVNTSGSTYVAYLFATVAGVSKVGNYTGTGALQTVACGFTSGARFVLIKRTDATGDWYVWDSARGITSGNDPYLLLNDTTAEVTGTNYVDTDTTGFKVTAAAPAGINASGGTYIFLAIA